MCRGEVRCSLVHTQRVLLTYVVTCRLVPVVLLPDIELKDPKTLWGCVLSVDYRRPLSKDGLDRYDRNQKIPHAYRDDYLAYEDELQRLRDEAADEEEWIKHRTELDARLQTEVATRIDVCIVYFRLGLTNACR